MKSTTKTEELGSGNDFGTPELTNLYKAQTPGQNDRPESITTESSDDIKADVADLERLMANPPEAFAKLHYGSIERYRAMLQGKIDRLQGSGDKNESLSISRQVAILSLITAEKNLSLAESFIEAHPIHGCEMDFSAILREFKAFAEDYAAAFPQKAEVDEDAAQDPDTANIERMRAEYTRLGKEREAARDLRIRRSLNTRRLELKAKIIALALRIDKKKNV